MDKIEMQKRKKKPALFTFADLFAGIGGFHQALVALGGECVIASEIDQDAINVYKSNFPNTPIVGDITKEVDNLPKFDVLVGGFPCQPFSKAGKQQGFTDPSRGNLFYTIIDTLRKHPECKFVLLENVKNLADKTENWDIIKKELRSLNYYVTDEPIILSPTQFGIPQLRERVYILGIRKDIRDITKLPNGYIHLEDLGDLYHLPKSSCKLGDAYSILELKRSENTFLSDLENKVLQHWLEFKKKTNFDPPHVPIWVDFFGCGLTDHEYETTLFHHISKEPSGKSHRTSAIIGNMPQWKQKFARKNRLFYLKHKEFIDQWLITSCIKDMPLGYRKFEWNCGPNIKEYEHTIIQFRQSGIRVKKNDYFPALVAIDNTPIIVDPIEHRLRRITPREAANLQNFNRDFCLSINDSQSYKQLGNAVNVYVIKVLMDKLINFAVEDWNLK